MTIKNDTNYGKLALDKTAELERKLSGMAGGAKNGAEYGTTTTEETIESSPVDGMAVRTYRLKVLKKLGAKIRITVSLSVDAADVKITLNGKELLSESLTGSVKSVSADGVPSYGENVLSTEISSSVAFTAAISVTCTGYFEACKDEVALSAVGSGYVGKFSGGEFGVYSVASQEKLFSVYGVKAASAAVSAGGDFCLATYSDGGGKIRLLSPVGATISEYPLGGAYTSFAVTASGSGFIVYAAKNYRLTEITVSGSSITEETTSIACKKVTYAENGGTKLLTATAPNGYSFVYEVE